MSAPASRSAVILLLCAGWLLIGRSTMPDAAAEGGAVRYQAGSLDGYPSDGPPKNAPPTFWQDRNGSHYRSAPPEAGWRVPWREQRENEERSWDLLDQLILDVSPYPPPPRKAAPDP